MRLPDEFLRPDEHLFLVPAEELSPTGIRAECAQRLRALGVVSEPWLARFDAAFALYWSRARELAARAPRHWLPPRVENVCVALDPAPVRPFFQPLGRASCLLEHGAFEPASSSLEFATFQFFQAERLGLVRALAPALRHDLTYWLARTPAEREDFRAGCRRAQGGRAAGWRALARALEWIPEGRDESVIQAALREPSWTVPGTALVLPRRLAGALEELERAWLAAATERTQAYFAAHAATNEGGARALVEWLAGERPLVVVTGAKGVLLWDPERPNEVAGLLAELAPATSVALEALRGDLEIVSTRSRAFLDSLVAREALPRASAALDQNGLAYLHAERGLVAYNVHEHGMQRLHEPSVPFERWMLAARTIHEWGHLAVEAGLVRVPEGRRNEFESVQAELAELFDAIVADCPPALRAHAARPLARLAHTGGVGRGLVAQCRERMSDWQANLLAQRYLAPVERETYVRNNVRPLLGELDSTALFQALARYAFEYQYLRFEPERDARRYFLGVTWFGEQYLARGVLTESRFDALLDAVGRLCRCHEVDVARFR